MSDGATTQRTGESVIDVHAHLLPPTLLRGDGRAAVGERMLPEHPAALTDLDERLATMDARGVDVQVVSPWIELAPTGLAPDAATTHVRAVNDALAVEVRRAPARLLGMAMLPQHDGEAAANELDRAVAEHDMCGALVTTSGAGLSLADPALDPLWDVATRRNALILLHPLRPAESTRCRSEAIADLVGTPVEGTLAVAGLMRAGVLDRFPGLRLCLVHGGGALPALLGRMDALWDLTDPAPSATRPTDLASRFFVDTLTHDDRALRWAAEVFGAHRLLLGSDFPFATGDRQSIERVRRLPASASERSAILGGTLRRLLLEVDHGPR